MCGIAGLYLPEGAPLIEANLDAMASVMAHRGPDGRGRFVSPNRRYQGVFTRLAIIDLDTGDQPIESADGKRVLMGNGEIYNYVELRREVRDYPFKTQGDMEVVLPLATSLGDDFVHRLNGMYALALYDAGRHRLVLVRDRLGVKPLYWARLAGGGVLFASEIKALFASGLIAPAVNEAAVSSYLAHGYVPAPDTLFRGVNKLAPGSLLSVDDGGAIAIKRYWRATMADNLPQDPVDVEDHLRDLLRDSLRLQLRSDVPVGALLSGGLDSGLMVALAAQLTDKPVNTFTVRFPGAAVDESPLAGAVAEHPDRFVGLGSVPLQNTEMAVAELERCVHELGLRGVEIHSRVGDDELSAPRLEPFFAKAEELGILIFIHTAGYSHTDRLTEHYFLNIIGHPMEATMALSHLIFDGVMDRHPGLKICVAHGGGFLPSYAGRMDHAYHARADVRDGLALPPGEYLKRFYFDTMVFEPDQLEYLIKKFGSDHILLGTDYPYDMGDDDPLGLLGRVPGLDEAAHAAIQGGNAAQLLKLDI